MSQNCILQNSLIEKLIICIYKDKIPTSELYMKGKTINNGACL